MQMDQLDAADAARGLHTGTAQVSHLYVAHLLVAKRGLISQHLSQQHHLLPWLLWHPAVQPVVYKQDAAACAAQAAVKRDAPV